MNNEVENSINSALNWSMEGGQQLIIATLDQLKDGEIVVLAMNKHLKITDDSYTIRERVFRYYMRKYCGDTAATWNIKLDEDEDSPRSLSSKTLPRSTVSWPQFSTLQPPSKSPNLAINTEGTSVNANNQDPKLIPVQIPANRRVIISQQMIEYSPEPPENLPSFTDDLISFKVSQQDNVSEQIELDKKFFPQEDIKESNSLVNTANARNIDNVTIEDQK